MAGPQLRAQFFVDRNGVIFIKAKQLPRWKAKAIFVRDGGICKACGRKVHFAVGNSTSPFRKEINAHVDHVLARSRGGQNEDKNLRLLCVSCNTQKGAKCQ